MKKHVPAAFLSLAISTISWAHGGGGGCGEGGGFGIGGGCETSYPFSLPKVEDDIKVDGFSLKVNRAKWGYTILKPPHGNLLASFSGDKLSMRVMRMNATSLTKAATQATPKGQVLVKAEPMNSIGGQHGLKATYSAPGSSTVTQIAYFFPNKSATIVGFCAQATGQYPDWHSLNELVPNTLQIL